MIVKDEDGEKNALIRLTGEITLSKIADLVTGLKQALADHTLIRLDAGELESIDLAGMQVLCSAHRTAHAMGKALVFHPPVHSGLEEAFRRIGFKRQRGCSFSATTSCLCCKGGD